MNPVKMIAVPANRNPEKFLHVAKKVILRDRSGNEKRFNQFEKTLRRGAFRAVSEMGSRRNDRHRLSMGWALVLAQLATQLAAQLASQLYAQLCAQLASQLAAELGALLGAQLGARSVKYACVYDST